MAAEARAGVRAYQEIKDAILSGELRQRQRLDIDELAARWRVSATPVRYALAVLTAERLVTTHASRGYRVAFWSDPELGALYEWRWHLARLASETYQPAPTTSFPPGMHAEHLLSLMRSLEARANVELRRAAASADERLLAAYRVEPEVLAQTDRELRGLVDAFALGDAKRMQQKLKLFFRRRIAGAVLIRARAGIKALPRNGE